MADDGSDEGAGRSKTGQNDPSKRPEARDDAELAARLQSLSAGLDRRRVVAPTGSVAGRDTSGYARAVKIGSEFIAGIVVGTGLGWMLDQWLGTRPWGMILFLLIGFAAGVLNVMRAEGMVGPAGIRGPDKPEDDDRRAGSSGASDER